MEYIIYLPITLFIVYVIIKIVIPMISVYVDSIRIANILSEDCDPETFLYEVEKKLQEIKNKKVKVLWTISKSTALLYLGRFNDSINILNTLDISELSAFERIGFICNMLHNLLHSGRLTEAEDMLNKYQAELNESINKNVQVPIIKGTLSLYHFYKENYELSKSILIETIDKKKPKLSRKLTEYYLGIIEIKLGNKDSGVSRLRDASCCLNKTFYNEHIKEILAASN